LAGVIGMVYYVMAKRDIEAGIVSPSSAGMNVAGLVTSIIGVSIAVLMLMVIFVVIVGGM